MGNDVWRVIKTVVAVGCAVAALVCIVLPVGMNLVIPLGVTSIAFSQLPS